MRKYTLTVTDDGSASLAPLDPPVIVPPPKKLLDMRGANLTGGATDWKTWADRASGPVKGTDYLFPTNADVDICLAAGMNTFRLLFTWEALQAKAYDKLFALGGGAGRQMYTTHLATLISYITGKGAKVILDIHGDNDDGFAAFYGQPVGAPYITGSGLATTDDALQNLWWQLATLYKDNPNVLYGITNEPHVQTPAQWYACAQKVINGIRSAGAKSAIIMPGTNWTGAGSWMTTNAPFWNLTDPLNNLQVQLHLYFDRDAGGGVTDIDPGAGVRRLTEVTKWAREKKLKLFLGEVGLSAKNPTAQAEWDSTHKHMLDNSDVFSGFAFWAYGPPSWWGGYKFTLNDGSGSSPQMKMIAGALK